MYIFPPRGENVIIKKTNIFFVNYHFISVYMFFHKSFQFTILIETLNNLDQSCIPCFLNGNNIMDIDITFY